MVAFSLRLVAGAVAASQLVSAALPFASRLRQPKSALRHRPRAHVKNKTESCGDEPRFTIPTFSNPEAAKFHVNSSALPLVDFTLQDSWAGRFPISSRASEDRELMAWYWPCSAPNGSDTLTIWLNGGPGCSSFEGFLEEIGPFRYDVNTSAPALNQYAWTTASDVLFVEQPVGTGFTKGQPGLLENESQAADEFYGFLTQFFGVFPELTHRKLFLAGESYAGFYIPYIATRIIDASPAEKAALPLNLEGLLMNDGTISSFTVSAVIPVARFAASHQAVMKLTDAQVAALAQNATKCGYDEVLAQVTYPPGGKIPLPFGGKDIAPPPGCDLDEALFNFALQANPCFNFYRVTDQCPPLGTGDPIIPYFSRPDVQALIHVPDFGPWHECDGPIFKNETDPSPFTETLLPHLLETLDVVLWHGLDDELLIAEGDRITIQNLTWGGLQGFQTPITTELMLDGASVGVWHSERKLTYLEIKDAGHMIPENQPEVALHVFKYAIGQGEL